MLWYLGVHTFSLIFVINIMLRSDHTLLYTGLEILYILGAPLRAKKNSGAKKNKKEGNEKRRKREKRKERRKGVKRKERRKREKRKERRKKKPKRG